MEQRTLIELHTVGRGGSAAYLCVSTRSVRLRSSAGTSIWKAALGTATLGASLLATGLSTNTDDDIEVPIDAIQFARTKSTGPAYSTILISIGGDSIPFSMASYQAPLAVQAINAAVAGGTAAALFAEAWRISRRGTSHRHMSTRERRKLVKQGAITQAQFERDEKIAALAKAMR